MAAELGANVISADDLLSVEADLLVPAALEDMITADNAGTIKAKVMLELANGPVTPDADKILEANGVREGEIFAGQDSDGLHAALSQVAELAQGHLDKARTAIAALPPGLRPAFAVLAILEAQLAAWKRNPSALQPPVDDPDWRKIARLTWWALRNR